MKKGKQKLQYGVNNKKFYVDIKDQNSVECLKRAGHVERFEEREEIFEENRPALMKMIRFSYKGFTE